MPEPILINRNAVLQHLKETQTEWPELKYRFRQGGWTELPVSELVRKVGVDPTIWALRTRGPELNGSARRLTAAFACGPDDLLRGHYRTARKGCSLFEDGLDALLRWIDGDLTDPDAAAMRWTLAERAQSMPAAPQAILQALVCGFAPHAWGGCGCAHNYALEAHAHVAGKSAERETARNEASNYHAFLLAELLG